MVKHFLPSFFVRAKKRSGPACNAGAFLATSLCKQRSSIQNTIYINKDTLKMQSKVFFHTAYVALGSNLGDKEANLRKALELLEERGVEVVKTSSFICTEPYGVTDQPQFLNGVCEVRTSLVPLALLHTLLEIEQEMGRVRLRHWGERNIDLDLLLYEDVVMDTPELILPHPDMQNRDFVLLPLAEIAPELVHPILQKTISELVISLSAHSR